MICTKQQRQQAIEGTVSDGDLQTQLEEEQAQMAEEQKGCAILDSGATTMVSSVAAADTIQQQMVENNEEGNITVTKSDKLFKLADGDHEAATKKAEVQITNGLLKGKQLNMHLLDKDGNETAPLYSVNDMREHRMVVDYEETNACLKMHPTSGTNFRQPGKVY